MRTCKGLQKLAELGYVEKCLTLMHLPTGESYAGYISRPIVAGKDGRLRVGKGFLALTYCPACGSRFAGVPNRVGQPDCKQTTRRM